MMYLIVDIEEEELKSICNSKEDVIDFAQEYYDYLFDEENNYEEDEEYDEYEEDKRPKDWNMALEFLEANSRFVLDLDKREMYDESKTVN